MKKLVTKLIATFVLVLLGVFTLASCGGDSVNVKAEDLVNLIILPQDRQTVSVDFTVPASVQDSNKNSYAVTWESKDTEHLEFIPTDNGEITAHLNRSTEGDVVVEFSAIVTLKNDSASKDFKIRVAQYIERSAEENFYLFYDTANDNTDWQIEGYILAKEIWRSEYQSASLYVMDSSYCGAYYIYSCKMTQEFWNDLTVGTAVTVNCANAYYSGLIETKASGTIALNSTLPAADMDKLTEAKDVSTEFKDATTTEGRAYDDLTYNQSRYVTITNLKVAKLGTLDLGSTSTTQTILTCTRNGQTVTIVVNLRITPLDGDDAAAIKAKWDNISVDDYISVTGLLSNYNKANQIIVTDGNWVAESTEPSGETDAPIEDLEEEFTGIVTCATYKDSTSYVSCYALVQSTAYPASAKYIYAKINTSDTLTAEQVHANWTEKFPVGKEVTIKGTTSEFNGLNQFDLTSLDDVVVGSEKSIPAYTDITGKVTAAADLTSYQGMLVKVTGTCVVDGNNYYIETGAGQKLQVYFDAKFQEGTPSELFEAGKKYTVSGFLNWYKVAELTPVEENSVVEFVPERTVTDTTITFSSLEYANAEDVSYIAFADGTVEFSSGTGTNHPKYYTSGTALRCYANNTITFSSTRKIASIEFVVGSTVFTEGDWVVNDGTFTPGETSWTWTGEANEVVFTNNGSKQGHIVTIIVTYAE